MPTLILTLDERELQACAVGVQPVSIGRLPDNTIVIDNPAVSARHARVYREGPYYVLEDLKSTNGTFVNDKPIARHTLLEGDAIVIGRHTLSFTMKGGEQAAGEPEAGVPMVPDAVKQKHLLSGLDQGRPSQAYDAVVPKTAIRTAEDRNRTVKEAPEDAPAIGNASNVLIKLKGWFKAIRR